MQAKQQIRYFLGANSPQGFYSLYDQLINPAQARAIYILKGGPGCGKSSLMRRVAQRAEEAGETVEYIHCSGDPDSLDAVILPTHATAIVDGTAPHGTAPLGHPAKKVSICKALRGRKYYGTSTCAGNIRTLLWDKHKNIRRNCSKRQINIF